MYQNETFEIAVLYGRRRVGKTTLITKFCEDKEIIFISALQSTSKQTLHVLSQCLGKFVGVYAIETKYERKS